MSLIRGVVASSLLMAGSVLAQEAGLPPDPVEGTWRTLLQSEITITRCEAGFCGAISKVVVPEHIVESVGAEVLAGMSPDAFFDANNEDPALRNRPILGLQILTLIPSNEPLTYDGAIYNPEDGKTYSGYVQVLGPDTIRLNGCVLYNIICRGEDWTRVPPDLVEAAE
jgi:uncharacterized protein (DUF2147 family)